MKFVKPIVATLAVALLVPAFAGYAPESKGTQHECDNHAHDESLILGNSPHGMNQSKTCWFNRIHLGAEANILYANARNRYFTGYTSDSSVSWDSTDHKKDQMLQVNNANLFVDADVNSHVDAHLNMHYSKNDVFNTIGLKRNNANSTTTTNTPTELGTNKAFHDGVNVDEAYVTYYDESKSPVFVKIGKMYSHFGNYHDPYEPTPGLDQIFAQSNINAVELGVASAANWEASAWVFDKHLADDSAKGMNKWGARVGYKGEFEKVHYNANASFINDARTLMARDGDDTAFYDVKGYFMNSDFADVTLYNNREAAWDLHLGLRYAGARADAGYTFVGSDLDHDIAANGVVGAESKPEIWSFGLGYDFAALGHDHIIEGGYETQDNGSALLNLKNHWNLGYKSEFSPNFEGYVKYDHYKLADNLGWETNGSAIDAVVTSNNKVRVWTVGLKAHI